MTTCLDTNADSPACLRRHSRSKTQRKSRPHSMSFETGCIERLVDYRIILPLGPTNQTTRRSKTRAAEAVATPTMKDCESRAVESLLHSVYLEEPSEQVTDSCS